MFVTNEKYFTLSELKSYAFGSGHKGIHILNELPKHFSEIIYTTEYMEYQALVLDE